jgi:hypothetical protein
MIGMISKSSFIIFLFLLLNGTSFAAEEKIIRMGGQDYKIWTDEKGIKHVTPYVKQERITDNTLHENIEEQHSSIKSSIRDSKLEKFSWYREGQPIPLTATAENWIKASRSDQMITAADYIYLHGSQMKNFNRTASEWNDITETFYYCISGEAHKAYNEKELIFKLIDQCVKLNDWDWKN